MVGWRTSEQTLYLEGHIAAYFSHADEGTLKEFWTALLKEWFERFPLAAPPVESVMKDGIEKATAGAKLKRVKQIKRFFTSQTETGTSRRQNLHLQDSRAKRLSEVQTYMTLFYESRIRPTVLLRWAKDNATHPERITAQDTTREDEATKIPIAFKTTIAQELWDVEDEAIKKEVRSYRKQEPTAKTVYNTEGGERRKLVREYAKNISSLQRNMATVLRNVDRKCAGKGIMWVACPTPNANGKPIGYFQCFGESPDGQDLEAYMGAEKTREFKELFTGWIRTIYPSSEQHLYCFDKAAGDQMDTNEDGQMDTNEDDRMDTDESEYTCGGVPPSNPTQDNALSIEDVLSAVADNLAETQIVMGTESDAPTTQVMDGGSDVPATQNPTPSTAVSVTVVPTVHTTENAPPNKTSPTHLQPTTSDSSLLVPTPRKTPARMQTGGKVSRPHLAIPPAPSRKDHTPSLLPEDAGESIWMKKKGTLNYLRLEEVLGLLEQTPKGFPMKSRPKVVEIFIKNGHNYKRNYGLEADTLGQEISAWWREINTTAHVAYGGPTGIYLLIVLITWWCDLLKERPNQERSKYVAIVGELDCVILATLHSTFKARATDSSTTTPPPSSQLHSGTKRAPSEDSPSRKRLRT